KPLTNIITVIKSIKPGKKDRAKPLPYATAIVTADIIEIRAISRVFIGYTSFVKGSLSYI
ncbi:MAG: hypothetical protein KGD61_11005, partial [Candidatus Lokiarchaeota archaeon]|nr:hypothetical protein [Candidatus Lokiarchaeota archaeon]